MSSSSVAAAVQEEEDPKRVKVEDEMISVVAATIEQSVLAAPAPVTDFIETWSYKEIVGHLKTVLLQVLPTEMTYMLSYVLVYGPKGVGKTTITWNAILTRGVTGSSDQMEPPKVSSVHPLLLFGDRLRGSTW
jgi:Holliday junction resolvasome RuvABC ATP-dependent DNA helicase subunit